MDIVTSDGEDHELDITGVTADAQHHVQVVKQQQDIHLYFDDFAEQHYAEFDKDVIYDVSEDINQEDFWGQLNLDSNRDEEPEDEQEEEEIAVKMIDGLAELNLNDQDAAMEE